MNSPLNKARYTFLVKPKQQHILKNRARKRKAVKENETTGAEGGTTIVATTMAGGALWPGRLHRFSNAAFCASFWFAGFALDHPSWACRASFATSLDLVWPQFHAS